MGATINDRGPDGNGVWASGPLALSFQWLKIVDLSEHGSQPMIDPELGLIITLDKLDKSAVREFWLRHGGQSIKV